MHNLEYHYQVGTTVYIIMNNNSVVSGKIIQLDDSIISDCSSPVPMYLIALDGECRGKTVYCLEPDVFPYPQLAWHRINPILYPTPTPTVTPTITPTITI